MSGYDYGNTRVRCRRAALLRGPDYERLVAQQDLNGVLGLLQRGAHGPDVEEALTRSQGLPCLHRAIRSHLARSLGALPGLYAERSRRQVELLLGRWQLGSLVALLRGVAAPEVGAAEVAGAALPIGDLDGPAVDALARQPNLRGAVDLLVGWGLPSRRAARALAAALPGALASGRTAPLEQALARAHARALETALDPDDPNDALVRRAAFAELDRENLLGVLRLRAARAHGEAAPAPGDWTRELHVRGGALRAPLLERVLAAADRDEAHGALAEAAPRDWAAPLARWRREGGLPTLDDGLRRANALRAMALAHTADPAGVGVPIAFAWAKQVEADNLRWVGFGRSQGLPAEQVREQLVVPWRG